MSVKLHPDKLNKEELEYEIKIRGVAPTGTVKDLEKSLKQLIKLQKEGHSFKLTYDFVAKDELLLCKTKLSDIKQSLSEEFSYTLARKLEARLAHILARIENITSQDKNEIEERSKLLSSALECLREFESKQQSLSSKPKQDNPVDVDFQTKMLQKTNTSTPIKIQNNSDIDNSSTHQVSQLLANTSINSKFNITEWGLKFSGESDALGLNAFLERVNELSESRGVSTQQIFRSAVELFEGKALVYYRSLKDKITDWNTLCEYFRDEFLPRDFNEKIWEQIKSRTQGDKESIAIYVAFMNNLFSRLTVQVDESVKLKILRKNILPFYQNQLLLVDVHSIDDLIKLCRKIEDNRKDILNFVPPSCSKNIVETDLSYKDDKPKKRLDNIELKKVSFYDSHDSSLEDHNSCASEYNENLESHRKNSSFTSKNKKPKSRHRNSRDRSRDRSRDSSVGSRDGSSDRNCNYRKSSHRSRRDSVNKNRYRVNSIESKNNALDTKEKSFKEVSRDFSEDRNRDFSRDRYRDYSGDRNRDFSSDRYRNSYDSRNRDFSRDRYRNSYDNTNRDFSRDRYRNHSGDRYRDTNKFRDFSRDRMYNRNYSRDRYRQPSRDRSFNFDQRNRSYQQGASTSSQGLGNVTNSSDQIVCYKCQGFNHIARFCTARSGNAKRNQF